jgi:hypothetical protein
MVYISRSYFDKIKKGDRLMKTIFFYVIMCILFILVTFFGLGPVIYADGSNGERIITLIIVLLIYALLAGIFVFFKKRSKNIKK